MNHLNINIDRYEVDGEAILWEIHCIINASDRIALVGRNGAGKSTFLKILSWEIKEYRGSVENIGWISLGYLEQIHFLDENLTVRDELRNAFSEIRTIENTIKIEEKRLEETWEYEAYTEAIERYKFIGGYTYENEIERVSRGIGIDHLLGRTLGEVSGWERTKIALAKTLLSKPEFLLLDEPTNFIDLTSVEWLEKYLRETWKWWYILISHDRTFLDETVVEVIEMLWERGIIRYTGNYSDSVEEKQLEQARQEKLFEAQETMISWEKALINRFRAWSRAGFAKSRERALEKVELLEKPMNAQEIHFSFDTPKEKPPELLIRAEDAFIGRSDPLFYIRELSLQSRERIGIVWENGVGKSTFLKTLLGTRDEEDSQRLKVLEWYLHIAKGIEVGYYSQLHESLKIDMTIRENFAIHGLPYSFERIGSIIKQCGFDYHDGEKRVSSLSWGERSRLLFSMLREHPYHLLILDEPTNHLDYDTREALEQALHNYEWSLLFISHDRYFVNKLAEKLWIIEDGELSISYGNYEDFRYKKDHGINLDMSLFDAEWEMNLVLEEKLWREEARRIKEKFARKKRR